MDRIVKAFFNSIAGLAHVLRTEAAVQQEAALLVVAIPCAFLVSDNPWVILVLLGLIVLMLVVELLNTAIEILCDHVRPEIHPQIKVIKDVGSAAVLLTGVIAAAAWLIALWQRLA